jgi:hypothetical protein
MSQPLADRVDRDGRGPAAAGQPRRLDAVVKFGLAVFVGSFLLIWGGMFLTRPDRSIPPFSIGAQQGSVVALHVPPWTTDAAIETLIQRFRLIAREGRDFGRMKIQPATPDDPRDRYARLTIYIFTLDAWAEPDMLRRYLAGNDPEVREGFEKAVRGYYRLEGSEEEGRVGPVGEANLAFTRLLFRGPMTGAVAPRTPAAGESSSPPPHGARSP